MDLRQLPRAWAVLDEAGALAAGDSTFELDAIRGDWAYFSGDYAEAIDYYARSLAWTSRSGESHQVVVDMRALELGLARAGCPEAALEINELARLHEAEVGRQGVAPQLVGEIEAAVSTCHAMLGADAVAGINARARDTSPELRIDRALSITRQAAGLAVRAS